MNLDFLVLLIAVLVGLYMAWNIGANDVANAFGTSIGSKALTFKQVVLIAAIFEFAGAVLVGSHVTDTVRKGIIDSSLFTATPELFAYGMVSALLAASIWLHIASTIGWPVSTTHSIVGGIAGFGLVAGGFSAIAWSKMAQIVISWILSPLLGGVIAAAMFIFISRWIIDTEDPHRQLKKVSPYLIFLVITILFLSIIYKGLKNLHLDLPFNQALLIASLIGLFAAVISKVLIDKVEPGYKGGFDAVERVFRYLQILTACYVAFAHGANDVANSIGPVAAVISVIQTKTIQMKVEVPIWLLFIG
ncbi:MAG: inorganic phosphate transporter, partial [Thermodesulfobacteriota bacterium]